MFSRLQKSHTKFKILVFASFLGFCLAFIFVHRGSFLSSPASELSDKRVEERKDPTVSPEGLALNSNYSHMVKMIGNNQIPVTIYTNYLIENPNLCSEIQNLSVVIIVHSSTTHFERRSVIRETWANKTFTKDLGTLRVMFMVGLPSTATVQSQLETEYKEYGDILQGDFIDTYKNITLKGVMGFKWLTERCQNAGFIVKVDDDVYLDTYRLLTEIRNRLVNAKKTLMCHTFKGAPILRNKKYKWSVSSDQFIGRKHYPTYCNGYFVAFSADLIPSLLYAVKSTPFFWIDDVYLFGVLPGRIPGVKFISLDSKKLPLLPKEVQRTCMRNGTCTFLAVGHIPVDVQFQYWKLVQQRRKRNHL